MPKKLNPEAEKEAMKIVDKLDSINFDAKDFIDWLKLQNFQIVNVGKCYSYKCNYGYILFTMESVGGPMKIIQCQYTPFDDSESSYGLIVNGKSSSGKTISAKELKLLQKQRFKGVENFIILIFAEVALISPDEFTKDANLQEDLLLENEDIQDAILKIEDEYDLIIMDEDVAKFKTVSDVIDFVRKAKSYKIS